MKLPREANLDRNDFRTKYLTSNKPVIVSDSMREWDLFWTPQEWSRRHGDRMTQVYDDLFTLIDVVPLRSFVANFMGRGTSRRGARDLGYVRWYAKMKDVDFVWADELFESISKNWYMPSFLPESDYLLPISNGKPLSPSRDPFPAKGLFISGEGAQTKLHKDPWGSDAVLCQLYGSKQIMLFAPERESSLLRNGRLMEPDELSSKDNLKIAIEPDYVDTLNPGEILFIPGGWYHHVYCLSDSVSLTWNFVHSSTWSRFFRFLSSGMSQEDLAVLHYFANLL